MQKLAIVGSLLLLLSCAEERDQQPVKHEYAQLLTGYSLADTQDEFVFEGKLFKRQDLSPERSYVFFKAYEVEFATETDLYVDQLAVLSECDLPEMVQLSLRIPDTYDVVALNSQATREEKAFLKPVSPGKYIFTIGVLAAEPCEGFEVGLTLATSQPERIAPVRPGLSPAKPVAVASPEPVVEKSALQQLAGVWQQSYVDGTRNITLEREFAGTTYLKKTYENEKLMEHLRFAIELDQDRPDRYLLTLQEIVTYAYSPVKYTLGDKFHCIYAHSEIDELRFACDQNDYPAAIPESYKSYTRKVQ